MTVICPRCNAQSSDDALYCTVCGMTLGGQPLPNDPEQVDVPAPEPGADPVSVPVADPPLGPAPTPERETDPEASWDPVPAWTAARVASRPAFGDREGGGGRADRDDDDFIPLQLPERHGGVRGVMEGGIGREWLAALAVLLLALAAAAAWGSGMVDGMFGDDPDPTASSGSVSMVPPATVTPETGTPGIAVTPVSGAIATSPTTGSATATTEEVTSAGVTAPAAPSASPPASSAPAQATPSPLPAAPTGAGSPTVAPATVTREATVSDRMGALEPAQRAAEAVYNTAAIVAGQAPTETPAGASAPLAGDGTGGAPARPIPTSTPDGG